MKLLSAVIPLGTLIPLLYLAKPDEAHPMVTMEVSVTPGSQECVVAEMNGDTVNDVRRTLEAQLGVDSAEHATTSALRAALSTRYGARVTESQEPMKYYWYWDEETHEWRRVCHSCSTFTIDFDQQGSVIIESREKEFPNDAY